MYGRPRWGEGGLRVHGLKDSVTREDEEERIARQCRKLSDAGKPVAL